MIRRQDAYLVSLGVALAFVTRLVTNVLTRPDFVGWFNHSTYYWVQTRSLLEHGQLAYDDMPLLFALYAVLAGGVHWAGAPVDEAIVVISRLVMAFTPALVPIAIYSLARRANAGRVLARPTWCLIIASGFLPLTYANMPETLQKNMLGLLLLSLAFVAVFRWLEDKRFSRLFIALLLAAAILLVHLGSALAALLLTASILLELVFRASSRRASAGPIFFGIGMAALFLASIGVLYPSSLDRIRALAYAFVPDNAVSGAALGAMLVVWVVILSFIWRWMARKLDAENQTVSALMRITVLWAGLLSLPLWPGEIGIRLLLFTPLSLLVVLLLWLSQNKKSRWVTFASVGTASLFCLMSVGEAISMYMVYPNKDQIAVELAEVRNKYDLLDEDLVITPYGVNPTANWFLGTKASLLTAVTRDAFENYARVFVLNTLERPASELGPGECKIVETESDRYWVTRHDVPLTDSAADGDIETFAFFELELLPENWIYTEAGLWSGWGECDDDS